MLKDEFDQSNDFIENQPDNSEPFEYQNDDSKESNDFKEEIYDAVTAFINEPTFEFDDFANTVFEYNGDMVTIGEALENNIISLQDVAESIGEYISDNASSILLDESDMEKYGDLIADICDEFGIDFISSLDDIINASYSVDEVAQAAFDGIFEKLEDTIPHDFSNDLDVFDLADMEFSIMDSIIDDCLIQDAVEMAITGVDTDNMDHIDTDFPQTTDTGMEQAAEPLFDIDLQNHESQMDSPINNVSFSDSTPSENFGTDSQASFDPQLPDFSEDNNTIGQIAAEESNNLMTDLSDFFID